MTPRKRHPRTRKTPAPSTPAVPPQQASQEREVELLHNDPGALVVLYQDMVGIVVWNAIQRGMFPPSEREELIAAVTAKLLELFPRLRRTYNGTSLLRTYVSAIVINLLNRMAREQKRTKRSLPPVESGAEDPALELAGHDIDVFVRRLDTILGLFAQLTSKLVVILKCYYRIALDTAEVMSWYPRCDAFSRDQILSLSRSSGKTVPHGELFAALALIVGEAEGRRVSADSLRKWTDHRIAEILRLLNGNPPRSAFDRKSLGELLERLSNSRGERTI